MEMCGEMCVDMRKDMCTWCWPTYSMLCVDICVDMCVDLCRHVYRHVRSGAGQPVRWYLQQGDRAAKDHGAPCLDVRVDMCIDIFVEMRREMCVDMCLGVCADMCIDICMDICIDIHI